MQFWLNKTIIIVLEINDSMSYNLIKNKTRGFMMKWILLLGVASLVTGCVYSTTEVVQYRQVIVAPVVEPVVLDIDYPGPLDVATTTIDYY